MGLHEHLRNWRLSRGHKLRVIADRLSVRRETVCGWELGRGITYRHLCQLAEFYGFEGATKSVRALGSFLVTQAPGRAVTPEGQE